MNTPLFNKFHHFFYEACSENMLAGLIASAESKGCEFLQLIPMQVAIAPQGIVKANGKPELALIFRVFVRCPKSQFERIMGEMQEEAKREQAEGLRQVIAP